MATWAELESTAPDLTSAGRRLLLNCGPDWGVALLGTLRADGAPRIGPLCVYLLGGHLYVTVEGRKERDLVRDPRYVLHSYWGDDGQDEFASAGTASAPIQDGPRAELVALAPRIQHSQVVRELLIDSAHSVVYRNFPRPDMYADVIAWSEGGRVRRWRRDDPAPPEDSASVDATAHPTSR
jgi:hypothetical protein